MNKILLLLSHAWFITANSSWACLVYKSKLIELDLLQLRVCTRPVCMQKTVSVHWAVHNICPFPTNTKRQERGEAEEKRMQGSSELFFGNWAQKNWTVEHLLRFMVWWNNDHWRPMDKSVTGNWQQMLMELLMFLRVSDCRVTVLRFQYCITLNRILKLTSLCGKQEGWHWSRIYSCGSSLTNWNHN